MVQRTFEPEPRETAGHARRGARGPNMGLWEWFSLYLAGAFLIVFIVAHVLAVHYFRQAGPLTFSEVAAKLRSPLFLVIDLGLLLTVFYHGLAGVRRVIIDLEIFGDTGIKVFTGVLALIGLVGVYFGLQIFIAFKV